MTDRELDGTIEWFEDLKETLEKGDIESVKQAIDAALDLLWRDKESRVRPLTKADIRS